MSNITQITAREIIDSRGKPTLRVHMHTDEHEASADVPSGASTGQWEAHELRDPDGGVNAAITNITTTINEALKGKDCTDQETIDRTLLNLDGTAQKSNLGGNALIGVSIACAKLGAKVSNTPLFLYLNRISDVNREAKAPHLYVNLINGGKHASSPLAFQEYHIIPQGSSVAEDLQTATRFQVELQKVLEERYGSVAIGDEGGFVIDEDNVRTPLEIFQHINDTHQLSVSFSLDIAATSFFEHDTYLIGGETMDSNRYQDYIINLSRDFELLSIEDPLHEEDFLGFSALQQKIGNTKLIGDDLTVTNASRLEQAIAEQSIQGLIIKPNQIGTLTEAFATVRLAHENNLICIASHRSGETMDTFIADFAYGLGCYGIKAGAPHHAERQVKYDRLQTIDHDLHQKHA